MKNWIMEKEKKNIIQEKSYRTALKILELVKEMPKRTDGYVIGNQLLRAGTSIGANVEEAIAGFSREDFIYKMNTALQESRETYYWLRLACDGKLIPLEKSNEIIEQVEEIMRILGAIVRSSKEK
jgi:four helix bundle protein